MDRKFVPVQNFIFSGLKKMLETEFDLDEVQISLSDNVEDVFRTVKPENRWEDGFMALQPSNFSLGDSRSNTTLAGSVRSHAMSFRGVAVKSDDSQPKAATVIRVCRVNFSSPCTTKPRILRIC